MKPKHARREHLLLAAEDLGRESELALFLGRFDAAALGRELGEAGILDGLARRGYAAVGFELSREENEHRLLVRAELSDHEPPPPLIELRCAEELLLPGELVPPPCGFDVLSVLSIRWLAMQDPKAAFTAGRPPLPGQRFPGLGLARALISRIHAWAQAWGKDAVVNFPAFFHNAVLYSELYRFASATRQGEFEALVRDLEGLSLAGASAALVEGRVTREGVGAPHVWEPGVMLLPLTEVVRAWLCGPAYLEAVLRAREAARFRHQEAQ